MKFIGLRTNIHLFKHAALYLLSYLLNTCVSCEWYTMIYSKKVACQKRNLGKYLPFLCSFFRWYWEKVYWIIPYAVTLENFVSIDPLMCSLSFQTWSNNEIGQFNYLTLRNLTNGYRNILPGNVGLQFRTFS